MKYFLFLVSLVLVSTVYGQAPQPLVDAELSFITNERIAGIFIQAEPAQAGKPAPKTEVTATTHGRSDKVKYRGPATLAFFTVGVDDKGRETRQPVTTVALPAGKKELLVVLLVGGANPSARQYKAFAFDDSFASAPAGSVRVLNMTPVPMFGRIGTENVQIAPGVSLTEPLAGAASKRISLGYMLNDQPLPVVDQSYDVESQERIVMAMLPPFARGSGAIRARVIRDGQPIPTAPATPPGGAR